MSRDQKIGLALGILLVGVVAAFFYRHEDPAQQSLPPLQTADDLNRQISRQRTSPYFDPAPSKPLEAVIDPKSLGSAEEQGLVPEPIALEGGLHGERVISATTVLSDSFRNESPGHPARVHRVQRGDTLSSIAQKYLGSSSRFEEIYNANRDVLRDANDLQVGKELKIPSSKTPAAKTVDTSRDADLRNTEPVNSLPAPQPASAQPSPRFIPHPGPRLPGPTATSKTGKRLSQLPPEDVIIRR